MPNLGVNIDHVATLRQARGEREPDPVEAALIAQQAGADAIVCHLREDRRHVQDKDVKALRKVVDVPLTLEMSLDKSIVAIAAGIRPDTAVFVPERRQEVTTEGGLDVIRYRRRLKEAIDILHKKKIAVSLFIDPQKDQIQMSSDVGADMVELHTGTYARARTEASQKRHIKNLTAMTHFGHGLGLVINAGHGLNYLNTSPVAVIKHIYELNIGHSIISRAVFTGLDNAVREMKELVIN